MKTVRQLMKSKSPEIWSVPPHTSVLDAVAVLAEKGIGSLLVMDGPRMVGILSERDYARKVVLRGKSSFDTSVSEIMITDVITVTPEHTNEDCMTLMTDNRIRHLPVLEDGKVVGLLSIGDLVKDLISEQRKTIEQLEQYIHGS